MLAAILALSQGCINQGNSTVVSGPGKIESRPLVERSGQPAEKLFTRLSPAETGIPFASPIDTNHPMKRLYHAGFACGGVAIGDVNGDQQPDIFLVSGPQANKLYLQTDSLKFEDATQKAGIGNVEKVWGGGVSMVDIDNDGDLDIYVCNYDSPNLLYINDGTGKFTEDAASFGLALTDSCMMSAFCDYDGDGDLDCYVLTNRYYREGGRPQTPPFVEIGGVPKIKPEFEKYYQIVESDNRVFTVNEVGRPDLLLQNNGPDSEGKIRFEDVTQKAGIESKGHGNSVAWWDYDGDGWNDLYVGNDFDDPDFLYRNNGDGTFSDVTKYTIPHTSWFSMGADAADFNNDGKLDFLTSDMSATTHYMQKTSMGVMNNRRIMMVAGPPPQIMRSALYVNTGTSRFMEAGYLAGLAESDWTWSVKLADYDLDGFEDVLVSNGSARNSSDSDVGFKSSMLIGRTQWDIYEGTPERPEKNLAFRNVGQFQFENTSENWGFDHVGMSYGSATGDLDGDGDVDVLVMNLNESVSVYRNNSSTGHRIAIRLNGIQSNQFGVGSRVELEVGGETMIRQLKPFNGYICSDQPLLHFGLGSNETVDKLTVRWPSGTVQSFDHLAADMHYEITEPVGQAVSRTNAIPVVPQFKRVSPTMRHREKPFDDFARQPLLPNKLSQLGPGVSVADVDGDGKEEFYLGGATDESGQLHLIVGGDENRKAALKLREEHARFEDMGSLFFDADGDGDQDLYVVSGGVECDPGDERLQDRLYLNDGNGALMQAADGALPSARDSGSCVAAADFDRDGDLDLFVGGRSIPGKYPLAANSRLLRNDSANGKVQFADVTREIATGLSNAGMVTGAVWSDANRDGWSDLLVTYDWGPVRFWENQQGTLVEQTQRAGLADRLGWFNGIAGRDIDNDGDIDYVVTNFGLNTKYHADADHPVQLYYGDLDETGSFRLVEAEFEDGVCYPVRGRSCSSHAMPFIKEKFGSYHDFALASLEDIYSDQLDQTKKLEVNELRTGVFINDGRASFEFNPLPHIAQISPGFGVVVTEVNGDGNADIYLAQNFFTPQLETGRMDGGVSLLLYGNGDGSFEPVWPDKSGLIVPEDAMSLAVSDRNDDGWVDFLVAVNDGEMYVYENGGDKQNQMLTVELKGFAGNPFAIGSRVTVQFDDGSNQTAEVYAGSGYLSQSTPKLFFGRKSGAKAESIQVVWPDGNSTVHNQAIGDRRVTLDQASE